MVDALLTKYEWRKHEEWINQYPQFTTEIDGQNIHFMHVESKEANARALMLVHGWPGSFVEFLDVIEPLTDPVKHGGKAEDAFHVVIPSIPGFGFSGPTKESGWGTDRTAAAFNTLMQELGYDKYGVQGGDAGAMITPAMARLAPENVIGVHVNAATMGFIPMGPVDPKDIEAMTDSEKVRMGRLQQFMSERFGFAAIQSSRPQALGYAISDSPAGLLAWMSELFTVYGDNPDMIAREKFLTNFMVYWVTGTAASSIRFYYEDAHDPNAWTPKENSGVPTAVAVFQEGDVAIRQFAEQGNNIVRWTEYEKGAHFAALEVPETLTKDVRAFFGELKG
jgi:pimeloyl-ACP methyl ester carboxylesterase